MDGIIKMNVKRACCVVAMLLMVLTALLPGAAYATTADSQKFTIQTKQVYTAGESAKEETFSYRLIATDPDSPMPAGSTEDGYLFTIKGSHIKGIGPIAPSRQGIFHYELSQVVGAGKPDITYDKKVYKIEVLVSNTKGTSIIVRNEDGTKADSIVFTNILKDTSKPSEPPVQPAPQPAPGNTGSEGKLGEKLPLTGDEMNIAFYVTVMSLAGIGVLYAILYIIIGGKRRKKRAEQEAIELPIAAR